jgi:hypothetical protein
VNKTVKPASWWPGVYTYAFRFGTRHMWLEDSKRFPAKEKEFIGRLRRRSLLQFAEISHRTWLYLGFCETLIPEFVRNSI